jgi:dihydropteroate synthase
MTPSEFDIWLDEGGRRRPLVMGILNVTPDSFSDGGRFNSVAPAIAHALEMARAGADLVDIGGESTRPGATPVEPAEQLGRVLPVIEGIRREGLETVLSIDTRSAEVAEAALEGGASLVNDVSAGRHDPMMLAMAGRRRAGLILMHMRGEPQTMQASPVYGDVTAEVAAFLHERLEAAVDAGVHLGRILLDPGIGFGKTDAHDLQLLREIDRLEGLGRPLVIGVSRKRIIGTITGHAKAADRVFGTAAAVGWSVARGAAIVRVHDVAAMRDVVRMTWAMMGEADKP